MLTFNRGKTGIVKSS